MIADELRLAGLDVIEGRGVGRLDRVMGVDIEDSGTPEGTPVSRVINEIANPKRAAFVVERSGRVWMLAQGPVGDQMRALVLVAAPSAADRTEDQADALAALLAVLDTVYENPEPSPLERDGEIVNADPETKPPRKRATKKAAAAAATEGDASDDDTTDPGE